MVFVTPGHGRCAVVASRKVGGAVARNRAKRMLREAWRMITVEQTTAVDVVLVAREGIRGMKTQGLVVEMTELLRSQVRR